MTTHAPIVHLRAAGVSLVLDVEGPLLPRVLHWGADLGPVDDAELLALRGASVPQVVGGTLDHPVPLSVVPEQSAGWLGTPGVTGHRHGGAFSTAFRVTGTTLGDGDRPGARRLTVHATDTAAALDLALDVDLLASGVVRTRAALTNTAATGAEHPDYTLSSVDLSLPVPTEADEILDFTGRWIRERAAQRKPFTFGTHLREVRKGRGHDATLLVAAGRTGFGYRSGEVWAVHVAWSGNSRIVAEKIQGGARHLAAGELLLAGEVILAPGETYTTPWVLGSYGDGLDEMSGRFHSLLRARPQHPSTANGRAERPVHINVWEAVYFDHDLDRLRALADEAAAIGVERYVLDDGWFRHRRDDTAGLGDWYVDEDVWPDGLHPLVEHVEGLGMEFGLWFEPEMVNPDSDLARAHPEWIMATGDRLPPEARNQQVLDLGHPGAFDHVLERIDAILSEYPVRYVKWDHNRDLVDAGHSPTGQAGVHRQTEALYRLLDEIRARHPRVEIESCSGGGGRADLGILDRTDRIWVSDCIDALERQSIEAGTGLLVPPEMMGSHIGSPHSHTTGRRHDLSFRAGTAFFSHLGIEWDLTSAGADDKAELARWIALHKRHRPLLHTGTVVRADHPEPTTWVHGVVDADRTEAIMAVVQLATGPSEAPGRVRLPGLDPDRRYRVAPLDPGGDIGDRTGHQRLSWWDEGVTLTGRTLDRVGVQAPVQLPEHLVLLHITAV
ncbi:alpha-galactosidase [Sanguibacter suaedae]|uniref:Alpha-galactosidase n=1 Tax=Sanguibacter suaedae TaxID=2795737 RepID=A0A934MAP3_9MICO|nr:alpha-galactosidase [Sanguibacter suaedae]MBI9115993.1 alpha-galactosidase [Sanguibacter suaedae]